MKAYVLHQINDLRYDEVPMPDCPCGWAIIKVKAAGICSSDIPRIFTKGTYHFPTIPGHEFAGIVEKVGSKDYEYLIGKRVGVFPLIPCRECEQCKQKHYEMCSHYDYIGSRRDGAFAEYVAAPVWNLIQLDESIPFTVAAMLEPLSVALHAVKQGNLKEGMNVGIIGTGMIGIAAGLWAKKMKASDVHVMGRSEEKKQIVEKCGLTYCTQVEGEYDFVIEAVGTPVAIDTAISMVKPGGTLILMGNPSDDILLKQDIYWRILRKQLHLCGTWNSVYDGLNQSDWVEAVAAIECGGMNVLPLVTHVFTQDHLKDGLELMRNKKEAYCKVMTLWNE